jgi:hypothetical protein
MTQSVDSLIGEVRSRVQSLLHDEVIEHTIVVMRELGSALTQLTRALGSDASGLTPSQKEDLQAILLPLTSESIREALHKGELPITNGIIRSKNRILTTLGVEIPESHREIDPRKYPNYTW